jgi:phenylacetate-CoA ligase
LELNIVHADLNNGDYIAWVDFLRKSEKWNREEIAKYQLREVQRILIHAYSKTIGYRKFYDQVGISPNAIQTLNDFQSLPFVDKEIFRDQIEEYSVPGNDRTYVTTGGSTGIPFGMYRDRLAFSKELASKAHQYHRVGWKEGDRQLVFRGMQINTPDHTIFIPQFNELQCSSYHLIPEFMEVFRQKAIEYRPDWIRCYPSSGYIFARWLKETKREFPRIKGVLCASENLYDYQKKLLSEVFGARIFSHYGHYELAALASFCEYEDTYHVLPQYGYVELIDKKGNPVEQIGQIGEIVATSFIMYSTPFIRYRTRDFAVYKGVGCPTCGRPYQIWERIEGRLQELIVTNSGRYISMTAINFHDDIFDQFIQFQFYQEEKGRVTLRFIPKESYNDHLLIDIRRRLIAKLGDDLLLDFQSVNDIPLTSRGKHRLLIQKLELPFGDM